MHTALSSRARRGACRQAFTLIEVMIVVVILGIMAMMVVPGATRDGPTRLRMAARLLVADIEFAQIASLGNGADPCVVVFDDLEHGYHIARTSDPDTPITDPASGMPYAMRFGEGRGHTLAGVTIESLDVGDEGRLVFRSLGVPDRATDAAITLRAGERTLTVRISAATGEPSIE